MPIPRPVLLMDHACHACSVSIVDSEGLILADRIQREPQRQAEDLAPMVRECLHEAGVQVRDLAAIACQRGPGSYTGLRIGAALAQGLALPNSVPLVGVGTLESMVYGYAMRLGPKSWGSDDQPTWWIPMMDNRRDEYLSGLYTVNLAFKGIFPDLIVWQEAEPCLPDENFFLKIQGQKVCFIGDGVPKWQQTLRVSGYIDKWKTADFVYDFDIVSSDWFGLVSKYLARGNTQVASSFVVDYRKPFFGNIFTKS